jgi:ParB family chromosome partitioning protein
VRKLDSGYYQIIAGERRWRAARILGLKDVPVRVIEADDRRTMEIALVENLQREDLNPIEEARGYRTLIEEYGMTQDEASQSIGKSRPAIANAMRLLSLSPPVMAMVEKGKLSAGHARSLLSIKDEADQLRIAVKVTEENLSVRQTENLVNKQAAQAGKNEQTLKSQTSLNVNYIADVERKLAAALGRRVSIRGGGERGGIELEYYGSDDRELLIDRLLSFGNFKGSSGD